MTFRNREEAAYLLAEDLKEYRNTDAVVLALPRGGVPLGHIIARELHLPLDIELIKKIGYPGQPEYAVGAVSMHSQVLNPDIDLPQEYYDEQTERIREELRNRYERYKGARQPVEVEGRTVLLVDDGIATGYTIMAAAQLIRAANPSRIVIAVPVASPRILNKLSRYVDEIVCLYAPDHFQAVGQFYEDFSEVTHGDVVRLLTWPDTDNSSAKSNNQKHNRMGAYEVKIRIGAEELMGNLHLPANATGIVIFSHGSGSSRHSSRNRYVASVLEDEGFGTLLFDLLTEEEDRIYENRFDIPLLIQRLVRVTQWLQSQEELQHMPMGYFGASTGAASALGAAAELGDAIKAVVSRGGRPDLALPVLPRVKAATLLLVGSLDYPVIGMNEEAYDALNTERTLTIVPGASHLFEEPGKLEEVAHLAMEWFRQYLR
ncbi:phosphoribosyltransferase [Pontibacter diazotrophicus]|uniref:Phosphoribosyltransferase n=1 Tax=Pontibacter diazotrophicus TaxID=1400979 RepID=A0A3D8LAM5_9BACT|nr:phosphoribosyltransferase family protein [Pontibacter diazotrophicus]RDV14479.1 phosphoribosyltransferase [Pontibacter diazotrophicus]